MLDKPLRNRRIIVTRAAEDSDFFAGELEKLGAVPIIVPAIEFKEPKDVGTVEEKLRNIVAYDYLIFTSRTAVRKTIEIMHRLGMPVANAARVRVLAIGDATAAEAKAAGFDVFFTGRGGSGQAFVDEFGVMALVEDFTGKRVLIPQSDVAITTVMEGFAGMGFDVDNVVAYRTCAPSGADPAAVETLRKDGADMVTFMSPSSVKGLVDMLPAELVAELKSRAVCAVIGPTTRTAAEDAGFNVTIEAGSHNVLGILDAILNDSRGDL